MEENDADQVLPAKATDEDIVKELDDGTKNKDGEGEDDDNDSYIYFQSSSIISILIIVMISLVCILATGLLIKTVLRSHNITRTLSIYLGFTPNRTIDESKLTFWEPESIFDDQPIETTTTIVSSSSSSRPPPVMLSHREKKAQIVFRNFILPALFLLSILCGILAFYMRLNHNHYPAWGARPRRPKQYMTIELKPTQTTVSL